jgi:hypothetical protein
MSTKPDVEGKEEVGHVSDVSIDGLPPSMVVEAIKQTLSGGAKETKEVPLGRWAVGTDNNKKYSGYDHSA